MSEDMIEKLAREAMFGTEVARTYVVNPVNGTASYSYVSFHGQRVTFHDGEFTINEHRDAGTAQAAAYATQINDALFDLAKRAARAAVEAATRSQSERVSRLVEALEQWKCPSCGGSKVYTHRWHDDEAGEIQSSEVPCKVCEQSGLHPIARSALNRESNHVGK